MNLKQYQKEIEKTWLRNDYDTIRILLGIGGEAGELFELYKKYYRGDNIIGIVDKIEKEIGDLSYYIAKLCNLTGLDWEKILEVNVKKLQSRKKRGKIKGSGDSR